MKLDIKKAALLVRDKAGNILNVNDDGSINVVITESAIVSRYINEYNEANAVPKDADTLLLTYTVPANRYFRLMGIECSGSSDAQFWVKYNGTMQSRKRNNWCERNAAFEFEKTTDAGDTIQVYVRHSEPLSQNFTANLYGLLVVL